MIGGIIKAEVCTERHTQEADDVKTHRQEEAVRLQWCLYKPGNAQDYRRTPEDRSCESAGTRISDFWPSEM